MKRADAIKNEIECIDLALKGQGLPTYSAMREQRDELLAALRDLADRDWTYIGAENDNGNPDSLYNRIKRARQTIQKATS